MPLTVNGLVPTMRRRCRSCDLRDVCSVKVAVFVSCKLWLYCGLRILYPLSQFFARDWGLDSVQMSLVLAAGEFVPAGLFSSAGDVFGAGKLATGSFLVVVLASGLMLLPPVFGALLVIRFMFGFGLFLFVVAAQTSATQDIPEHRRDCLTSILELPYSLSAFTLIPLLGIAYENLGWQAPFTIIALACGFHIGPLFWVISRKTSSREQQDNHIDSARQNTDYGSGEHTLNDEDSRTQDITSKRQGLRTGFIWSTGALAYNLSGLFMAGTINILATEFGFLLHSVYGLEEGDSATAALIMGAGELLGSLLAAINFAPGLKALEYAGGALLAGTLLLGFIGNLGLGPALVNLFLVFLVGEFSTIQRFSRAYLFASPIDISAMLGSQIQFQVIGRTLGAGIAGPLFYTFGEADVIKGHMLVCAVATGSSIAMIVFARLAAVLLKRRSEEVDATEDDGNDRNDTVVVV